MEDKFGIGRRPREQWPIVSPKGERTQDDWIVACFCDDGFTLQVYNDGDQGMSLDTTARPYDELWKALRELPPAKKKRWLIGHRVRYALERADFINALANGDVALPQAKKAGKAKTRAGKLSYSLNCVEIDLVAGKNKVKLLDWKNFGFEPPQGYSVLTPMIHFEAQKHLRRYLDTCKAIGLRFNKTTSAQLGWQHARIDYPPSVLMYNLDTESRAMERRAYYGGRNEPYRLGPIGDAVMSLDVKSFYAWICATKRTPIYLEEEFPLGLHPYNIEGNETTHWIADVEIATPTADYPVNYQDTPIYPTGNFFTTLAWPELEHALKHGRVTRVIRAARYKAGYVFDRYAKWFLCAKRTIESAGDLALARSLKAMFNASLGYTARQRYELKPWAMDIDRKWWLGYTSAPDMSAPIVQAQVLDGVKEWLKVGGEPREAMPFLHATICSWGRLRLLEIMQAAGREWVYYCDTDGLLVDYRGYANLIDTPGMIGHLPGQLGERFKSGPCTINGQKDYQIGETIICSGMPRTRRSEWAAKEVLTTPTGLSNVEGEVSPFTMACEDVGDQAVRYVNRIV